MERVGVDDEKLAQAIERDRSTVSRIRRGKVKPDAETLLRLNAWAEEIAREKRIPRREWLSWDHLLTSVGAPPEKRDVPAAGSVAGTPEAA